MRRRQSLLKRIFNKKILILLIVFGIVGYFSFRWVVGKKAISKRTDASQRSVAVVNQEFEFPGLTNEGSPKGKIKMTVTTAEKNSEVLVKDQTFKAKDGKIFLIVNLELTNDSTRQLNIFPGDLIRLSVEGKEDRKFAPDLHNNMVLIAPISTKLDRVGFVVEEASSDYRLQVGELDGEKQTIKLNFTS